MRSRFLKFRNYFIIRLSAVFFSFSLSSAYVDAQSFDDTTAYTEEEQKQTGDETEYDRPENSKFRFSEQLYGDSTLLKQRRLPEGYTEKLKKDKNFWYADADIKKNDKKQTPADKINYIPLGQRTWVKTLLWLIIIGGFAAALMWYLAGSEVGLFRKKQVPVDASDETDEMPQDIFAINYQKEIDKAAAQGNYRLAVRMMFLRLLKNLSDKNIINYRQDKTNLDYLTEMYASAYYSDFFRLTRHYEYSWYGKFDISYEAYQLIADEYDQLDRNLLNR
jgi:hypothetical protein